MTATTLRRITAADEAFLRRLYGSTREEELAQTSWTDDEKQEFLRFQFDAQHKYYTEQFPDAAFDVIEFCGASVGRLYVDRREDEIRLIDIAFLPENRGGGMGSAILKELMEEAKSVGKPVAIHVEQNNPAMRLYLRLGFRMLEEQGVYHLMQWSPEDGSRKSPEDGSGDGGGSV